MHAISILGILGLFSLFVVWFRLHRLLDGTTLTAANGWAFATTAVWLAAWIPTRFGLVRGGIGDLLWYAVSVLLLCPPIAVLGARRPTVRVWNWFVLLPLVLVFWWPALSDLSRGGLLERWTLEEPVLAGYVLVLIMGTGNYAFESGWFGVLACNSSALLLLFPLSPFAERSAISHETFRSIATGVIVATVWISLGKMRGFTTCPAGNDRLSRVNRLWRDFRCWFGVVWSHRIRESFNATARKSGWPVVLSATGLIPMNSPADSVCLNERTESEIEQTLRWLLRRFVDPEWIDRRLNPTTD